MYMKSIPGYTSSWTQNHTVLRYWISLNQFQVPSCGKKKNVVKLTFLCVTDLVLKFKWENCISSGFTLSVGWSSWYYVSLCFQSFLCTSERWGFTCRCLTFVTVNRNYLVLVKCFLSPPGGAAFTNLLEFTLVFFLYVTSDSIIPYVKDGK